MTVVAAYLYRHGKRIRPVGIDERVHCPEDKSEPMPELGTRFGYPVVIGVIVLVCAVLYARFNKARWL